MIRRATASAVLLVFLLAQVVLGLEEGHHFHFGINNLDPTVARANYTYDITLQAHGQQGMSGSGLWIEVNDYGTQKPSILNGVRRGQHPISVSQLLAGPVNLQLTVPFGEWSLGRHEIRFRLNSSDNFESNRQFVTTRTMVTVGNSTANPSGRPSNWLGGGGGWYESTGYAIGIQQTPFANFKSGASTSWRVQSNANRGCLFKNPQAHAGSVGTPIGSCWSGTGDITRTMPTLVPGDRVMLYSEDTTPSKQNAGAYVIWVPAPGDDTYKVDYQSWWNTSGLSVP